MMSFPFEKLFKIVSRHDKSSAWHYSGMFEDFNFLRRRFTDKTLYVGFIGSSSSGKSTLINSIIRKNIMPVDVLEGTTEVPCIIKNSADKNLIHAAYSDNTSRKFAPADKRVQELLRRLLISGGLKYFSLSIAGCNIPDDIALVDLPGTEHTIEHDSVTLYAAKNLCNALAVVMTGDKPLSMSMIDFLKEDNLYTRMQNTIFILSKPDSIGGEAELNRLISFIASKAERVLRIKSPLVVALPAIGINTSQSLRELQAKSRTEIYDFLHARKEHLINEGILSVCRTLRDELKGKLDHYGCLKFDSSIYVPASYEFQEDANKIINAFINNNNFEINLSFVPFTSCNADDILKKSTAK